AEAYALSLHDALPILQGSGSMDFDLLADGVAQHRPGAQIACADDGIAHLQATGRLVDAHFFDGPQDEHAAVDRGEIPDCGLQDRSEEHTSELPARENA